MGKNQHKWTIVELNYLLANKYRMSYREMAQWLADEGRGVVSPGAVAKRLLVYKYRTQGPVTSAASRMEQAASMRREGRKLVEIARALGVTRRTVSSYMASAGLTRASAHSQNQLDSAAKQVETASTATGD